LWKDRFRKVFGEPTGSPAPRSGAGGANLRSGEKRTSSKAASGPVTRQSKGADQFFAALQSEEPLTILDMAAASQANIMFITELGHRLASDDIIATMEQCFGDGDFLENQENSEQVARFLSQTLKFPDEHFDGALVWDCLQFLAPSLLEQTVEQLMRVMKPGGVMLAFFNSDEKAMQVPVYNYRIQDQKNLLLVPRGAYRQVQYFNNRALELMFDRAQSLKFFLTRDSLREVLIRR
jgi:SAM-dependent methyltransferase